MMKWCFRRLKTCLRFFVRPLGADGAGQPPEPAKPVRPVTAGRQDGAAIDPLAEAVVEHTPAESWRAYCELRAVLDRHPSSRAVLSHLAILEQGLRCSIGSIPDYLPASFIDRARGQLSEIALDAEAPTLCAMLESALASRGEFLPAEEQPLHAAREPHSSPEMAHVCPWPDTEVLEESPSSADEVAQALGWLPTMPLQS